MNLKGTLLIGQGATDWGATGQSAGVLSAGSDGSTLVADSTQPLGVKWGAPGSAIFSGTATGFPVTYPSLGSATSYDITRINVMSDDANIGAGGLGPSALGVYHTFGGAAMHGNAIGIASYLVMNATTGNVGADYVGQLSIVSASAPDGGANSAIWSGNDNVFLGHGATGWKQLIGREIDVSANSLSSVQDKLGLQIVQPSTDAVVATRSNIGITFNNGNAAGATGWDCMVSAGGYAGNWPMSPNGTIIGAWAHAVARNGSGAAVPTDNAGTTLNGLDWRNVTFTGDPLLLTGYRVGNTGFVQQTPRASASLTVNGQLEFEATSNTTLTVKYRGSDGVTRSTTLTLS